MRDQYNNVRLIYTHESRTSYIPRSLTPGPASYKIQTHNLSQGVKFGRGYQLDEDVKERTFKETQKLISSRTPGPQDYQNFTVTSHVDGPQIKIKQKYPTKYAKSPGPCEYSPKIQVKSERDIRIGIRLQEIRNQKISPGPAAYFNDYLDRAKPASPGFKISANGGQIDRQQRRVIPIQMNVK
ncbi:hypothetical protein SS50377_22051 [Spironucleus salmonicida]|uniref:SHIPPO 1-like protein n=1 Tax=Spironucleus salmonicida TaxID=348837 RepID=V6LMC5_9EUKA|nr:hypothetical protein SS50377_22051 [Spironucleus salmonicida]|eukprot:EST45785.1 Hypothetical protein SS50377_14358 [Spironucleus salmonicida]